jgi:hypothetical protein
MFHVHFTDITTMNIKAYGFQVELLKDRMIISPRGFAATQAIGGETGRVIVFENIRFLEFKKGGFFVNTRITIGEPEGKTYIPFVPSKKNNANAELFYNTLYAAVKPYGKLSDVGPKGLRNDRLEALKAAHDASKAKGPN